MQSELRSVSVTASGTQDAFNKGTFVEFRTSLNPIAYNRINATEATNTLKGIKV